MVKLGSKMIVGGVGGGVLSGVIVLGIIALIVLQLVGLGFLTKLIFAAKKMPNGNYCIQLDSKVERNFMRLAVVLSWISIGFTSLVIIGGLIGLPFLSNLSQRAETTVSSTLSSSGDISKVTAQSLDLIGKISGVALGSATATLALAFLALQGISVVGWIHLTKVAFKGTLRNNLYCAELTESEVKWCKTSLILRWLSIGFMLTR
jgi:hypothetical protein